LNTQDFLQQLSFERIDVSFAIVVGLSMIFAFIFLFGYFSKVKRTEAQAAAASSAQAAYDSAAFDRRWANLVAPSSGVVLARAAQSGEVVQPGQAILSLADQNTP
jgi:hypothetical protein